jgi:hypothetical protein
VRSIRRIFIGETHGVGSHSLISAASVVRQPVVSKPVSGATALVPASSASRNVS